MEILITGATGLVGSALGQRLVHDGHTLRILSRNPASAMPPYPCRKFKWDGVELPPRESLEGVDAIIHLAGENIAAKRWTVARKKALQDSRIRSAGALKQAVESYGVRLKVFISASGAGYYGDQGDAELSETSLPGDDFLAQLCVAWESAALEVPAERTVIFRLGVVLSARGGFLREVLPVMQRFGASALGTGRQHMPWIHLEDCVAAFAQALTQASLIGSVNLVAPESIRNADLTRVLAERLQIFSAPAAPAVALKLALGELSEALLGSQRVVPARLIQVGFKWKYQDFASAIQNLLGEVKPGEFQLVLESWVPAPKEKVWQFFSSEHNLERITPPILRFTVVGKSTPEIQKGTRIDYRLRLRGLPLGWQSEITTWEVGKRFVDIQIKGPYSSWHHLHEFESLGGGTLMRDSVRFKLPMGLLGRVVSLPFVLKDVEQIFAYRHQIIEQEFSGPS